jgi:hypothetical protein
MVNYEDYEDDPWSEDYEDAYHEEDYELNEEQLAKLREQEEFAELSDEEIYEKMLTKSQEEEYEYDEVVGGRDKKPILSALNKKKLSQFEMDELFNKLGDF